MNDTSDDSLKPPAIKVIGIGGCGINAINHMIENGIRGAEFIAISSDMQELDRGKTGRRLHLASANKVPPAIGISALMLTISEDDRVHIQTKISGADIVFIVAGMGGCTGTSIAPIAAKIARDMNILTIAVVSMPFLHEGNRTLRANQGIEELSEYADAFVIIPNSMLMTDAVMRVSDIFIAANNLVHMAVSGIAESVSDENMICLDIADLRMIFANVGMIAMGTAIASGENRAKAACERTILSTIPSTINLADARTILLNITASSSLKLREIAEILECAQFAAMDAVIIAAAVVDESWGDDLRLTLFATNLTPVDQYTCLRPRIRMEAALPPGAI